MKGKRLTTEEFVEKAKAVHGNKYNYSKVEYISIRTKVTILCPIHGEFEQNPHDHINNKGCPKCGREKVDKSQRHTLEQFIDKAKIVHENSIYDYSKVNYVNNKTKVTIVCQEHGEFQQKPDKHLAGHHCPKCANINISKAQRDTLEEFISKAKLVHGDKYDYSKVVYTNNKTKVIIICKEHGEFKQKAENHINQQGCPSCAKCGFDQTKPGILYYLKITTDDNQVLYKIGITNRTVNERFQLKDLAKIEIVKQKLYDNGAEALEWETKLKRLYKQYQYKGPDILSSGNSELFTEDIIAMYYKDNCLE